MLRPCLLVALVGLVGCKGLEPLSHPANPLGWPAKGLSAAGFVMADSEIPLAMEFGRLLYACGDLLEAPALLVESPFRWDLRYLQGSGEKLLTGLGGSMTSSFNLPFFFMNGGSVDIGVDAERVNQALAFMESLPPEAWQRDGDARTEIFPKGTRVRASGNHLIWEIPGEGDVIQRAAYSPWFRLVMWASGKTYEAQERSWGMVVTRPREWRARSDFGRAETIIHEFYHQDQQIRQRFFGWSPAYWPAYGISFLATGWDGHWAETGSGMGAQIVDRALRDRWVIMPPVADSSAVLGDVLSKIETGLIDVRGETVFVGGPMRIRKELKDFRLAAREVTQEIWEQVMGYNPSYVKGPDLPVHSVSRAEIDVFISRINAALPAGSLLYRLPFAAEWEVACRAGDAYFEPNRFYGVDKNPGEHEEYLATRACFAAHSAGWPAPVGSFEPNPWGFFDMLGNVEEITESGAILGGHFNSAAESINPWREATYWGLDESGGGSPTVGFRLARGK